MPIDSGDDLPTHNCCSCVGKVERLERKLKDLGSRLTQCCQVSRYPTCMRKWFLTYCLSMVRKWIGHIHIDSTNHLQTYTDFQVFLGMDRHAQTVKTRLLSLLPHGLGMRPGWAIISYYHNIAICITCLLGCQHVAVKALYSGFIASLPGSPPTQRRWKIRRGRSWYPFTCDAQHIDITALMN